MACAVTRRLFSCWERSSALLSSSPADSPLTGHVCLPFLTFVVRSSGVAMSATRDGELFKSPCAQLYLVGDGDDESLLMQSGRFAVVLFKNPVSQLGAVVAMVDEVQWPLGHDASVTKKEEGSFTFTLPGFLIYDLILKELPSADLRKLEHILREYSNYGEPSESQSREKAAESLKVSDEQSSAGSSGRSSSEQRGDTVSSQMKRRMLRAHRMSAVVKVFSRSLARGAISAANHVERRDTAAGRHAISSDLNLAGVDAVAKVVEAVETGGRALLESIGSQEVSASPNGTEPVRSPRDTASTSSSTGLISPMWTLNKPGLLMLYRVISVSLAMHSSSSSSGSGRSGSSSSTEIRRLFSSPSFSSSSSGRSMSASPSRSAGADHPSTALSLQPPIMPAAGGASMLPAPPPPPPPLFSETAPRVRQSSMPPPSGPPPLMAGSPQTRLSSSDCSSSSPFRIYRPRPSAGTPTTVTPPSFIPRPPRFHPPPKG